MLRIRNGKMKIRINLLLFIMIVMTSVVYSQNDSIYKFVLPKLVIVQTENLRQVKYEFENERTIFIVKDGLLEADTSKYDYSVNLADLNKITFHKRSDVGVITAVFAGVGFALGFVMGGFYSEEGRLAASIGAGAAVGLVAGLGGLFIGSLIAKDYYEDFTGLKGEGRKKAILDCLRKNRIRN
jgi:hypothetical protein